jgi:hypothetical protein
MLELVPTNGSGVNKSLAELSANKSMSAIGVGLLAGQIIGLEKRCAEISSRIEKNKRRRQRSA